MYETLYKSNDPDLPVEGSIVFASLRDSNAEYWLVEHVTHKLGLAVVSLQPTEKPKENENEAEHDVRG